MTPDEDRVGEPASWPWDHVGEPAPWPFTSERHADHARLRRSCANAMAWGVTVLALLIVVHYAAAWAAALMWWVIRG